MSKRPRYPGRELIVLSHYLNSNSVPSSCCPASITNLLSIWSQKPD